MPVLDELLIRIGMDSSGVEEGAQETTSRLDGLAGPAAAAGLAAGAVFAAGISSAMDLAEAQGELQRSLDLTEAEAERAGGIAGDVYSSGFGESLSEVSTGLASVTSAMGKLGDFTDAELEDMTKKSLAFAKTFEIDVADASTAAGQLISQGLVKDSTEAFDVMTKAAQTLPKSMVADLPAIVTEYGTHFKRIGLDASTAFGMMSQFVKAGGKDIDQAADVLHEFARITSEETARATDGFKALGLNAGDMLAAIGKGGKPAADALALTLEKLRGVEDPAQRAQLQVALFGDMAGEAADALLAMNPQTALAASGMNTAAGASTKLVESMEASPAQQMDAAMRTLQTTLGEAFLPILKTVSEFFAKHKDTIKELIPIVLVLITVFGLMAAAIWIVNIAMMANPIGLIIAGIIALIAVIALIVIKWDEIKAKTLEVWDAIVDKLAKAWIWMRDKAGELWDSFVGIFADGWIWLRDKVFAPIGRFFTDTIPGWVESGVQWVKDIWNEMIGWFQSIPDKIASGLSGMWSWVTDGLKEALNGAIGLINSGIFFINDKLIGSVNMLPGMYVPYIPYVPYLAEGGVTTGPTLAMIGEGSEQEAVLPLSKLDALINTPTAMAAPSTGRVAPIQEQRIVLDVRGADSEFVRFFRHVVDTQAAGSVIRLGEG
ncbi:phage tail tape measure protein [Streptomyces sp. NPDC004520]|uniref:phage tail tape measure protein n=1 Tax=Streptomyces sp. NPDC004520 TaxID=3364702 RepID=UPI0036CD8975